MTDAWPPVPLGEVLRKPEDWIAIQPNETYRQVTVRLWGQGVVLRNEATGAEIAASQRLRVRAKQFILSRIDARNGALGLVPESLDGAVVSSDFPVFTPNPSRILPQFLDWLSKTKGFVDLCRAASEGTTNRIRLKEHKFLAFKIPLPPLDEQRRIVARIDQLVAKIQEAGQLRDTTAKEANALHAAALSIALAGVPIEGHVGDVLLSAPRNGWSVRCNNTEGGIPVLSLAAVTGFQYKPTEFKRTSEPTVEGAQYWLRTGDLLMTRSNTPELVGHAAIYDGSPSPCIYPDLMMRLEVNTSRADTNFVHRWLMSVPVRDYIASTAKGTSPTMKKIAQGTVMRVPFPSRLPLPEQRRIVAYLDGLQAKVDALKRLQTETAAELDALLPSILDKAFKGEL